MRMSFAFPERRVLRTVLYPSCFCLREKKKKKNTNDENASLCERRKKKRERERARPRERTRASSEESSKPREEGPPHKISNLLVLDPRREREREREIASKPIARSYRVLPGSHDNL